MTSTTRPRSPRGRRDLEAGARNANMGYAPELARRGYVVLCPDYPSFGDYAYDFAEDDCESVVILEFHELQVLLPPVSLARPPLVSYTTEPVDCEAGCQPRVGPRCRVQRACAGLRLPRHAAPHSHLRLAL